MVADANDLLSTHNLHDGIPTVRRQLIDLRLRHFHHLPNELSRKATINKDVATTDARLLTAA